MKHMIIERIAANSPPLENVISPKPKNMNINFNDFSGQSGLA